MRAAASARTTRTDLLARPARRARRTGAARLAAGLALLLALGAGCKGDRDKCAQAAQRFAELVYWEREDANIAKLPPEQRDAERKRKLVEFTREMDAQLEFRTRQCMAANNDDQADCIIRSKTAAEALECAEIAKSRDD